MKPAIFHFVVLYNKSRIYQQQQNLDLFIRKLLAGTERQGSVALTGEESGLCSLQVRDDSADPFLPLAPARGRVT